MDFTQLQAWLQLLFSADIDNIRLAIAIANQIPNPQRDSYLAIAYLQTRTSSTATHSDTAEIISEYFWHHHIDISEYFYFASYTETNTDLTCHWLRLAQNNYEFWPSVSFQSLTIAGLCYLVWIEQALLSQPHWHDWPPLEVWQQWLSSKTTHQALKISSRFKLPRLPNIIFTNPNINDLSIYAPQLESIPLGPLYQLPHLQKLTILNSNLERLDLDLRRLPALRSFSLIANHKPIKIDIEAREQLQELDLSHNKLNHLPLWVRELPRLEYLRISGLKFERFPPAVLRMPLLKFLGLGDTKLHSFPDEFGQLQALESLDLSRGLWERLPDFFANFKRLERLELFQCNFKEFPPILGEMPSLRHLDISGNFIRRLDLELLGQLLPRLEYIGIRDAFATTNLQREFEDFARNYPNLLIN